MVADPNSTTYLCKLSTTTWVCYNLEAFGPVLLLFTLLRGEACSVHISLILSSFAIEKFSVFSKNIVINGIIIQQWQWLSIILFNTLKLFFLCTLKLFFTC
jgi:hypothetical protein